MTALKLNSCQTCWPTLYKFSVKLLEGGNVCARKIVLNFIKREFLYTLIHKVYLFTSFYAKLWKLNELHV